MKAFNKTVVWYGLSSSSKLTNPEYIRKLRDIVAKIDYISLRDTNSADTLSGYGIDTKRIQIVDDIACSNRLLYEIKHSDKKEKIVLVYICSDKNYHKLCDFTIKILEWTKDKDTNLVFVPFCEVNYVDKEFYNRLADSIKSDRIEICEDPRNLADFLEIIRDSKLVISMRYHGTLFANFIGCNVINLKNDMHSHYKNKIDYLYEHYKFRNKEILYSELNEITKEKWDKLIGMDVDMPDLCYVYKQANEDMKKMIQRFIFSEN